MSLFKTLPAPAMEEMSGEFAASMLIQRNLLLDLSWRLDVYISTKE